MINDYNIIISTCGEQGHPYQLTPQTLFQLLKYSHKIMTQ